MIKKKSAQPIRTQHLNLIHIKKNRDKTSAYVHALTFSAQSEGDIQLRWATKKISTVETLQHVFMPHR